MVNPLQFVEQAAGARSFKLFFFFGGGGGREVDGESLGLAPSYTLTFISDS